MPPRRHAKRDRMRQDRQNAFHARKRAAARDPAQPPLPPPDAAAPPPPPPPRRPQGEPIELTLTGMAPGGEALGRHEGMVVFVTGALPGETVRAQITERRSTWARAQVSQVLDAAPARTAPRCIHFGLCGGCDWQHIDYAAQVEFKTGIVREQLTRLGKLPDADVRPCLPCPAPYGYRNTTRLAVNELGQAGYRVAASHAVFAVEECPILEASLQGELDEVRALRLHPGDEVTLRVPTPIRVGAHDYQVSLDSFFQVNTFMAAHLVEQVLAALALAPGATVLDLYAGVGLFTLPLAEAVGPEGRVLAVESAAGAVADGKINTGRRPQVSWLQSTVEAALARGEVAGARWSHILLDPPRKGVEAAALHALAALGAPTLVYVSCEPATLARDVRVLAGHGYALRYAQPLDLFPQTAHVETVAVLGKE